MSQLGKNKPFYVELFIDVFDFIKVKSLLLTLK